MKYKDDEIFDEDEDRKYREFWEGVFEEWLEDNIYQARYDILLHKKTKEMYERD